MFIKRILLLVVLILNMPVFASMSINCRDSVFERDKINNSVYAKERWVEPYRFNNFSEKPVKQWYNDTMEKQRKETWQNTKPFGFNKNKFKNDSVYWK